MSIPFEADARQRRDVGSAAARFATRCASPRRRRTTSRSRPACRPRGSPSVELMMAVWTPGSYLVREFSRHVEDVTAEAAGKALSRVQDRQEPWRVDDRRRARVTVRYRVYGREMTVRTNFIEADFALLNGAADVPHARRRPHAAPARGRTGAAGRLEDDGHGAARRTRRRSASVPCPRLRHPGRFAHRRRQSGGLLVHGAGQAALPRQCRRGRGLGRPAIGRRRAEDRRDASPASGGRCRTTSTCSST